MATSSVVGTFCNMLVNGERNRGHDNTYEKSARAKRLTSVTTMMAENTSRIIPAMPSVVGAGGIGLLRR